MTAAAVAACASTDAGIVALVTALEKNVAVRREELARVRRARLR